MTATLELRLFSVGQHCCFSCIIVFCWTLQLGYEKWKCWSFIVILYSALAWTLFPLMFQYSWCIALVFRYTFYAHALMLCDCLSATVCSLYLRIDMPPELACVQKDWIDIAKGFHPNDPIIFNLEVIVCIVLYIITLTLLWVNLLLTINLLRHCPRSSNTVYLDRQVFSVNQWMEMWCGVSL